MSAPLKNLSFSASEPSQIQAGYVFLHTAEKVSEAALRVTGADGLLKRLSSEVDKTVQENFEKGANPLAHQYQQAEKAFEEARLEYLLALMARMQQDVLEVYKDQFPVSVTHEEEVLQRLFSNPDILLPLWQVSRELNSQLDQPRFELTIDQAFKTPPLVLFARQDPYQDTIFEVIEQVRERYREDIEKTGVRLYITTDYGLAHA